MINLSEAGLIRMPMPVSEPSRHLLPATGMKVQALSGASILSPWKLDAAAHIPFAPPSPPPPPTPGPVPAGAELQPPTHPSPRSKSAVRMVHLKLAGETYATATRNTSQLSNFFSPAP